MSWNAEKTAVLVCLLRQGNVCNLEKFIDNYRVEGLKLLFKQRMFSFTWWKRFSVA